MVLDVRGLFKDFDKSPLTLDLVKEVLEKYDITLEKLKASFKEDLELWINELRKPSPLSRSLLVTLYILRADRDFLSYLKSIPGLWIPGFTWWVSGPYTNRWDWSEEENDRRFIDCCMKASIYVASRLGHSRREHLAQIIDEWIKFYGSEFIAYALHDKEQGFAVIEVTGIGVSRLLDDFLSNLERYFDIRYDVQYLKSGRRCRARVQYY